MGSADEESTPSSFSLSLDTHAKRTEGKALAQATFTEGYQRAQAKREEVCIVNDRFGIPQTVSPMSKNGNQSIFSFTPAGWKEEAKREKSEHGSIC